MRSRPNDRKKAQDFRNSNLDSRDVFGGCVAVLKPKGIENVLNVREDGEAVEPAQGKA